MFKDLRKAFRKDRSLEAQVQAWTVYDRFLRAHLVRHAPELMPRIDEIGCKQGGLAALVYIEEQFDRPVPRFINETSSADDYRKLSAIMRAIEVYDT